MWSADFHCKDVYNYMYAFPVLFEIAWGQSRFAIHFAASRCVKRRMKSAL
jgi:hypothetical protein